jgi:hypothetical protein
MVGITTHPMGNVPGHCSILVIDVLQRGYVSLRSAQRSLPDSRTCDVAQR